MRILRYDPVRHDTVAQVSYKGVLPRPGTRISFAVLNRNFSGDSVLLRVCVFRHDPDTLTQTVDLDGYADLINLFNRLDIAIHISSFCVVSVESDSFGEYIAEAVQQFLNEHGKIILELRRGDRRQPVVEISAQVGIYMASAVVPWSELETWLERS
jgi:hypothetical protein